MSLRNNSGVHRSRNVLLSATMEWEAALVGQFQVVKCRNSQLCSTLPKREHKREQDSGHPIPQQIIWRVSSSRLILHLCRLRSLTEPIEIEPELCGITSHDCQHWNTSHRGTFSVAAHCSLSRYMQHWGQLGWWLYRGADPGSGEGLREDLGDDYSVLKTWNFLPEAQKWILPFFSDDGCPSCAKETALGNQSMGNVCAQEPSLRWAADCWVGRAPDTGRPIFSS